MTDLIQRIEQAKEPRRELFEEALTLLHATRSGPCHGCNFCRPFRAMLDAQAWTSAAEMLVPDGWDWAAGRMGGGMTVYAWCGSGENNFAAHPSLALLAAILRAERKDDE